MSEFSDTFCPNPHSFFSLNFRWFSLILEWFSLNHFSHTFDSFSSDFQQLWTDFHSLSFTSKSIMKYFIEFLWCVSPDHHQLCTNSSGGRGVTKVLTLRLAADLCSTALKKKTHCWMSSDVLGLRYFSLSEKFTLNQVGSPFNIYNVHSPPPCCQ